MISIKQWLSYYVYTWICTLFKHWCFLSKQYLQSSHSQTFLCNCFFYEWYKILYFYEVVVRYFEYTKNNIKLHHWTGIQTTLRTNKKTTTNEIIFTKTFSISYFVKQQFIYLYSSTDRLGNHMFKKVDNNLK